MPHSVEMPAPVNGTTTSAASTRSRSRAIPVSRSAAIMYDTLYRQMPGAPLVLPGLLSLSCPGKASRACTTQTERLPSMRYLHTMLRVRDLDAALKFFCDQLGLVETPRRPDEKGRYTNVFLAAPQDLTLVETSLAAGPPPPLPHLTSNSSSSAY